MVGTRVGVGLRTLDMFGLLIEGALVDVTFIPLGLLILGARVGATLEPLGLLI